MVTKKKKGKSNKKKGRSFASSRVKGSSGKDLTIHFMPYSEIAGEDTLGRIKKLMGLVLDKKIIILQGRLSPEEEARLIENSMTLIGNIEGFQGIEIATLSGESETRSMFDKVRHNIARILIGEQDAVTIIGPASIVKDMKKDPKKIELMLKRK